MLPAVWHNPKWFVSRNWLIRNCLKCRNADKFCCPYFVNRSKISWRAKKRYVPRLFQHFFFSFSKTYAMRNKFKNTFHPFLCSPSNYFIAECLYVYVCPCQMLLWYHPNELPLSFFLLVSCLIDLSYCCCFIFKYHFASQITHTITSRGIVYKLYDGICIRFACRVDFWIMYEDAPIDICSDKSRHNCRKLGGCPSVDACKQKCWQIRPDRQNCLFYHWARLIWWPSSFLACK